MFEKYIEDDPQDLRQMRRMMREEHIYILSRDGSVPRATRIMNSILALDKPVKDITLKDYKEAESLFKWYTRYDYARELAPEDKMEWLRTAIDLDSKINYTIRRLENA